VCCCCAAGSAGDTADGWALFRLQPFVRMRVFSIRTGTEVDCREGFEDAGEDARHTPLS
jgi:hypothetical protein